MIMGIGRGDSARRVIGLKPVKVAEFEESSRMVKRLMNGEEVTWNEKDLQLKWARTEPRIPLYVAGYGPKRARRRRAGRGRRDHPARRPGDHRVDHGHRPLRRPRRRDAIRRSSSASSCAPSHISDDIQEARDQVRWFPAMVSNHVMDLVERYGENSEIPAALTDYVKARKGYDYKDHSRVGAAHGEFVTDEIGDRFCVLGTVEQAKEKLRELESVGVDQFNIYLMTEGQEEVLAGLRRRDHPRVQRGRGVAGEPAPPRAPDLPSRLDEDRGGASLAAGAHVEGVVVRGADLRAGDLSGLRLGECELEEVTLDEARLAGAGATDVVVRGGSWANVRAERSTLRRVRVERLRATGVTLSEAELVDVDVSEARLDLATFRLARLERVAFVDCRLDEADFGGARLVSVRFDRCSLTRAVLTGSQLERCELASCDVSGLDRGGGPRRRARCGSATSSRPRRRSRPRSGSRSSTIPSPRGKARFRVCWGKRRRRWTGVRRYARPMSANSNGAVLEAAEVTRRYGEGETAVDALRGVSLAVQPRRARRRDGPVRLRQVDADAHPRGARPADRPGASRSPARTSGSLSRHAR